MSNSDSLVLDVTGKLRADDERRTVGDTLFGTHLRPVSAALKRDELRKKDPGD